MRGRSSSSPIRRSRNAIDNLARANIASGFGFWNQTAGFDISQTLIEYTAQAGTYGRAFWVGLLNTLLVAAIGIVLATIVGLPRRHRAAVEELADVAKLADRLCRADPQHAAAAATAVLVQRGAQGAADLRDSWSLPGSIFLNNRGFFAPAADLRSRASEFVGVAFVIGVVGAIAFALLGAQAAGATGQQSPVAWSRSA